MVQLFEMAGRLKGSLVDNTEDQAIIDFNSLKAERAIDNIVKCIANDQ